MNFSKGNKRIYKEEFNRILRSTQDISDKEREYLNNVFSRDLVDGLTEFEIKEKINSLRQNQKDNLDQWELERVKKRLLEKLGK